MSLAHTLPLHFLVWEEAIGRSYYPNETRQETSILCAAQNPDVTLLWSKFVSNLSHQNFPIRNFQRHYHEISQSFHIQFFGGGIVYFAKYGRHQAKAPGQLRRGRNEVLFLLNFLHIVCLCLCLISPWFSSQHLSLSLLGTQFSFLALILILILTPDPDPDPFILILIIPDPEPDSWFLIPDSWSLIPDS